MKIIFFFLSSLFWWLAQRLHSHSAHYHYQFHYYYYYYFRSYWRESRDRTHHACSKVATLFIRLYASRLGHTRRAQARAKSSQHWKWCTKEKLIHKNYSIYFIGHFCLFARFVHSSWMLFMRWRWSTTHGMRMEITTFETRPLWTHWLRIIEKIIKIKIVIEVGTTNG